MILTLEQLCEIARGGDRSIIELAERAEISAFTMRRLCVAHGIPYRKRVYGFASSLSDEEKAELVGMFRDGVTIKDMTAKTGHSHKLLVKLFRSLGLKREPRKGPGLMLSPVKRALLMRMVHGPSSDIEIADAVGWKENTVRKLRRSLGYGHQPKPDSAAKEKLTPVAAPVIDDAPKKRPAGWYLQQWDRRVFGSG